MAFLESVKNMMCSNVVGGRSVVESEVNENGGGVEESSLQKEVELVDDFDVEVGVVKVNDQLDKVLRDIKKIQIEIPSFKYWKIYKNSTIIQYVRTNVVDRLGMKVVDEEIKKWLNVSDHEQVNRFSTDLTRIVSAVMTQVKFLNEGHRDWLNEAGPNGHSVSPQLGRLIALNLNAKANEMGWIAEVTEEASKRKFYLGSGGLEEHLRKMIGYHRYLYGEERNEKGEKIAMMQLLNSIMNLSPDTKKKWQKEIQDEKITSVAQLCDNMSETLSHFDEGFPRKKVFQVKESYGGQDKEGEGITKPLKTKKVIDKKKVKCFKCQKFGHYARECGKNLGETPTPEREPESKKIYLTSASNRHEKYPVIIDSGADVNLTGNKEALEDYREFEDNERIKRIEGVGGDITPDGIGSMRITLESEEDVLYDILVEDIIYAEGQKATLITPEALTKMEGVGPIVMNGTDDRYIMVRGKKCPLKRIKGPGSLRTYPTKSRNYEEGEVKIFKATVVEKRDCDELAVVSKAKEEVHIMNEKNTDYKSAKLINKSKSEKEIKAQDLHESLGHPGMDKFKRYWNDQMKGESIPKVKEKCEVCIQAKQVKNPRVRNGLTSCKTSEEKDVLKVGAKFAMDTMYMNTSTSGNRYVIVIMDVASRYTWLFPVTEKSAHAMRTAMWEVISDRQLSVNCGTEPPVLVMDNDPTYSGMATKKLTVDNLNEISNTENNDMKDLNRMFSEYCKQLGVKVSFTNKNASTQNGVCERQIRSVRELTRAIIIGSGFPYEWWDLIMYFGVKVLINLRIRKDQVKTPWELFKGIRPPLYKKLKPIGCKIYFHDPWSKWMEQGHPGVFLGYDIVETGSADNEISLRWWFIDSHMKIQHSRDITFLPGIKTV